MGGGEILKKGWLIKSPPLEGGGIKSWRKRFFYLRSSKVLEYHKSEKETGELKGVINLEDCKAVNANLSHKKYKFVFDIETKDRTYFLVATSQEEMTDWVDTICKVCNFSSFALVPGEPPRNAKINSSKSPNHQVSAPLPPAGVPLNERFKPIENGLGGDSIYSLAVAEQQSVHKQLSKEPEIPAGVSLSEALATKGMGTGRRPVSTSSRASFDSSSLSDATINRLSGMSDSHYFAPRSYEGGAYFEVGMDPHSLYASPTNNAPLLNVSPGRFDSKSRAATMLPPMTDPLAPDSRHRGLTSAASYGGRSAVASGSGAQMLENGYMKPRPCPDRVPDYDYPPLGPPRPADQSSGNVSPPRQHRSALLNRSGSGSPTSPDDPHTYMNVSAFHEGLPPPIDRTNKPPPPQPPRVDRQLKPSRKQDVQLEDDSPLPPNKDSPSFPRRAGSLSGSPEEEQGFFADSDVPRRTSKSTTYVQVQFDPESRRPIPLPRSGPQGKPSRPRVEYADVDLVATRQLSEENERLRIEEQKKLFERQKVTLRGAEKEYLAEKDYVNLDREGQVDDDTNPDYYTFMRGFTIEDADKPAYYIHELNIQERPDSADGESLKSPTET